MTKHTVIILLGSFIVVFALGGFPSWLRTTLLVLTGVAIATSRIFRQLYIVVIAKNLLTKPNKYSRSPVITITPTPTQ